MAIYNREIECMDRDALRALQSERLRAQVARMYDRVPLFRQRMEEARLTPADIRGAEDLHLLPFSYKKDLRDTYPYGMFAVPMSEIVRLHASSGTTGKQIVVGYTANDLVMWENAAARSLSSADVDRDSFVQISFGYGLFTGGLGVHGAATRLGAAVIPTSSGNTARQITTMADFGTTTLCCTPSYAMFLAESIEQAGALDSLKLKSLVCGAEPWTEDMRQAIQNRLRVKAYDIYGLSEIMGPGVAYECECQQGMHICEDLFIPEIIDHDTGEVLPMGQSGELVFTTLTKEGFPLIRYRTGDVCRLIPEPCSCGRTHIRMEKPSGRADDMLIIRGVNVFPSQIEEVLLKVSSGTLPNYQIEVDRVNNTDTLDIMVEMSDELFTDDVRSIEAMRSRIVSALRSILGLGAVVHMVNPRTLERSEGKAKRVIDRRKLH